MLTTINKPSFGAPEQKGNVTIYPAVSSEVLRTAIGRKLRVAAYVRVSTDTIQQDTSLELQREYYENYIKNNPEYEFAGIYEEDGVTATSVEKRKNFLRMIEDCEAGKIDLIIAKSVSRFARNTSECLQYADYLLNSLNSPVKIHFELERITTGEASWELFLTFHAMFAQEESRINSEIQNGVRVECNLCFLTKNMPAI